MGKEKRCRVCRPRELGYLAWHYDAERRAKRGERQRQCPGCGLWLWPDELPPFEDTPEEGAGS